MSDKSTILFVGSFLSNSKGTKGIAEKMRPFLEDDYNLLYASPQTNKVFRMLDVLRHVLLSKFDVVHCDIFSGQVFWVAELVRHVARIRGKKVIMNLRGGRFLEYLGESSARLNTFQKWMATDLTIISPSKFLADGLKGLCNAEVQVVPNFIDLSNFPYESRVGTGFRMLWVRAFNVGYQPEIAVEALKQIRGKYPDASLTMVGPDKGTLPQIQKMIKQYDLSNFIDLTGPVPNTELYPYFHTHDVYLNTTAHESFGLAVFEAAACGIPIVSTRVGELPYIWQDQESILFAQQQNGEAFSDAIGLLFNERPLMKELQANAQHIADQYTWEAVQPLWEELFKK